MALRVVGAGVGRTGTMSLKLALERLLGAPCYHMAEVFQHPGHADLWRRASLGGAPTERLLVWRAGDGWEPLCRALELPVPDEPFPRANTREDFHARVAQHAAAAAEPT